MNDTVMTRPRVFIEESFPIDLLNEQVLKETGSTPFNAVHRWFSRKPLSFSRASVLASLLPADTSIEDFKRLLCVPQYGSDSYRLYQKTPSENIILEVLEKCRCIWGDSFNLLDAFAGGGSIPFESIRYGIPTIASDLNPVAVATMKAAIEVPLLLGSRFTSDLEQWVTWIGQQAEKKLQPYFVSRATDRVRDYLWTHTATCPECTLLVPLSPSWWVDQSPAAEKNGRACAVRMIVPELGKGDHCSFAMVQGSVKHGAIDGYNPTDNGTVVRKVGRCPRCKTILSQQYLCLEGQAERLGFQMYAVAYHDPKGKLLFRVPGGEDLSAYAKAITFFHGIEGRLLEDV